MGINSDKCLEILKKHDLLVDTNAEHNLEFDHISYDSNDIKANTLFFCKGNKFKSEYLDTAIDSGASMYISEKKYRDDQNYILVNNIQKALAVISAEYFGNPQNELYIVGLTGTKGKTTAAYFMYHILQEYTHEKTALFSTIDRILGDKPEDKFKSDLTTPESLNLFHDMRKAVDNGMTHLVMEVSSQAFKKNRVYNLTYDVGIFLNISPDHIGENEHPTFGDYLYCKKQMMANSKICVINKETRYFDVVLAEAQKHVSDDKIYTYSQKMDAGLQWADLADRPTKGKIGIQGKADNAEALGIDGVYDVNLPGTFNENDAVAAAIASGIAGASKQEIADGLAKTTVPGRMEVIETKNHGYVYVDYAHNYISMKSLLSFIRKNHPDSKVRVIVGSPGNKGVSRRADFGHVLTEEADEAILTTDDPAFENPRDIAQQIDDNIDHDKVEVHFEMDREKAIYEAIESNGKNDVLVIAGKGQDPYQKVNGVDTPYASDSVIAKQAIKKIDN